MSVVKGTWRQYLYIARPDHWIKHIFLLPGVIAALALMPSIVPGLFAFNCFIGLASACLIASANYVINEWLDAESDRHHPEKMARPAAVGLLKPHWVYIEYALLAVCGIALAYLVNVVFLSAALALLVSGVTYNIKPLRTKDRVYLDVISEAINNPIRLVMGWSMVSSNSIPPLSLFAAYWTGGAFLMAAKRLSEYSFLVGEKGQATPGLYRKSFFYYSIESLTISCFVYALTSAFGIAVFLVKYRAEMILTFPFIIVLFGYYLHLAMQPASVARKPETMHRDWRLIAIVIALVAAGFVSSFFDFPLIERMVQSRFVGLHLE